MKKLLLSALVVCAFVFTTNAQEVTFGAKAGLNMANLVGDVEDNSMLIGAHVGGMVEISFSDKFAVQPELLFSIQGTKDDDASFNLNYINVPVMAKYFVTEEISIEAGPQVGLLMSAKYDGEDANDGLSTIDFGLNFGAGYKMESGLNFALRYNLGLSNVYDFEGFDDKAANAVMQVSVGYFFN
ncbi:MAG: hypothetical protein COA88_07585 [Kordia sp.]|nr:MAG: hypothetical protein COA88_07585 [Kordia sp.]